MLLPSTEEELTQFILSGQKILTSTLVDGILYEKVCEHISNNLFLVNCACFNHYRNTLCVYLKTQELFNVSRYAQGDRDVFCAIVENFVEDENGILTSQ